jgi:polysaccharide biosynthesis PFTS motif protein
VSSEPESKVENEEDTNFYFLLNWPNILVYNERQKNVLESSCQKGTHIILTEPIYYNTSKIDLLNNDFPILAIFDIEPINFSEHFAISTYQDYDLNNSKFHIKFLQDIINVTKNLNCIVVLKPKREMSPKRQVKDYILFINNIKSSIKIVDSNIAPHRIIEKATCVISFPFTSTAFIAKEYNIKYNAFYDSSCTLSINDRASSGVLMINNKDHLKQWLINCFPVKTLDGL